MLWDIDTYPEMFDEEENICFFKEVAADEILEVLKAFKKDKSLGTDGWIVEMFTHFFEIFKYDLLNMVESSNLLGIFILVLIPIYMDLWDI